MEAVIIASIAGGVAGLSALASMFSCYQSRSKSSSSKERETTVKITTKGKSTTITKPDGTTEREKEQEQTVEIENMKMDHAQQMTSVTVPVENKTLTAIGSGAAGTLGVVAGGANAIGGMISQAGPNEAPPTPSRQHIPSALIDAATNVYGAHQETKRAAMEHGVNNPQEVSSAHQVQQTTTPQQIQVHGGVTVVIQPHQDIQKMQAYVFDTRQVPVSPLPMLIYDQDNNEVKLITNGREIPLVSMNVEILDNDGQSHIAIHENNSSVIMSRLIQVVMDPESGNMIALEGNDQFIVPQLESQKSKEKEKEKEKETKPLELKNVVESDHGAEQEENWNRVEEEEVIHDLPLPSADENSDPNLGDDISLAGYHSPEHNNGEASGH